jgi:hypothetical protein
VIRIERSDPLSLLRELPGGWAQSVITGPPDYAYFDDHAEALFEVLVELARVTRTDATLLWNVERDQPLPLRELAWEFLFAGWHLQKSEMAARNGHLLFAKRPRFHWQPDRQPRPSRITAVQTRRPWCIPAQDDTARQRLERLLLAATSRSACGACGTPRTRGAVSGRPGVAARCGHRDPQGRCLVIDPFHLPGSPLAALAVSHGRSYLGLLAPLRAVPERTR